MAHASHRLVLAPVSTYASASPSAPSTRSNRPLIENHQRSQEVPLRHDAHERLTVHHRERPDLVLEEHLAASHSGLTTITAFVIVAPTVSRARR